MKSKLIQTLVSNKMIEEEEKDIYEYGYFVLLFNFLCIFSVICIGILLNEFINTCIFLLAFTPIRILSGGFHLKSPLKCLMFFSTCYFILLNIYIKLNSLNNYFIILIVVIYLFFVIFEYINKPKILVPLIFFIIIDCSIFILMSDYYILQYTLFFNTILYLIPKFLKSKNNHIV